MRAVRYTSAATSCTTGRSKCVAARKCNGNELRKHRVALGRLMTSTQRSVVTKRCTAGTCTPMSGVVRAVHMTGTNRSVVRRNYTTYRGTGRNTRSAVAPEFMIGGNSNADIYANKVIN